MGEGEGGGGQKKPKHHKMAPEVLTYGEKINNKSKLNLIRMVGNHYYLLKKNYRDIIASSPLWVSDPRQIL